jgi:hypothetical protein
MTTLMCTPGESGVVLSISGEHEAAAFLEAMTATFIRFYGEGRLPISKREKP